MDKTRQSLVNKEKTPSLFFRQTALTTVLAAFGKALGFLLPIFLASWFGGNWETDGFYFSYSLIIFLASLLGQTLAVLVVPYTAGVKSLKKIANFCGKLFISSGVGVIFLTLGGFLIFYFLGFLQLWPQGFVGLTFSYLFKLSPLVLLIVWSGIFEGILQAQKRFFLPAATLIFRSLLALGFIYLFKKNLGLDAVCLAYLLSEGLRFLILWIALIKAELFSFNKIFNFTAEQKDFYRKAGFQFLAFCLVGLNPLIDRSIAAGLGEGKVSILYYSEYLYNVPLALLFSGYLVTLLSYWSASLLNISPQQFKHKVNKAAGKAALAGLLFSLVALILIYPFCNLLAEMHILEAELAKQIALTSLMYFWGLLPYFVAQILNRAILALRRTWILLLIAFFKVSLNYVLNLLLSYLLGLPGIALATSIVSWAGFLLSLIVFKRLLKTVKGLSLQPSALTISESEV